MLLHFKDALRVLALKQAIGLLVLHLAAFRAFGVQVREDSVDQDLGVVLGLLDNAVGNGFDLVHERGAIKFALFHRLQFVLPLSGHLGRTKLLNTDRVE